MLFRPQGLLGYKEMSFVNTFDWIKAGGFKKLFAKKAAAETVSTDTTAQGESK
jgi:branched-chain amino acid transport system permease protein